MKKVKNENYKNYMKYAYEKKAKIQESDKESTKRRKPKVYKK